MNETRSKVRLILLGVLVLLCVGVGSWFIFHTPTAPPGTMPAVPAQDGKSVPMSDGGIIAPRLSAADADKVNRGETVEIAVPGGKITIGPPPATEKSK